MIEQCNNHPCRRFSGATTGRGMDYIQDIVAAEPAPTVVVRDAFGRDSESKRVFIAAGLDLLSFPFDVLQCLQPQSTDVIRGIKNIEQTFLSVAVDIIDRV